MSRTLPRILPLTFLGAVMLTVSCNRESKMQPSSLPSYDEVVRQGEQAPRAVPMGRAAIRPSLPGVPSFTEAEARAYAEGSKLPLGVARNVHVTEVTFLSSAEVGQRLNGASTGLPDDTPLCYVEMKGDFTFSGPPGAEPRFVRGFEVFDAKTGNLLLAGGLPDATPTDSSR